MRVPKLFRLLGVSLVVLALVAGVTVAQDEGKVLENALNMAGGDLETIDPGLAQVSSQIDIVNQLFIGLTHQNEETATVEPGMATEWEESEGENGTAVYTFHLLENVPWVRVNTDTGEVEQVNRPDGNPAVVTAQDFIYSIARTLDPATGGAYAYVLAPYIVGGQEFLAGEGAADALGLRAVDDFTLEITSPEAVAYAPSIYGLWMARAVPQWVIEEFGDDWTEPGNMTTYGPFALGEWEHDVSISLVKNPLWPGTDTVPVPALDRVNFYFLDPTTQFAEYQAGNLHAMGPVALEDLPRVEADPELSQQLHRGPDPCTYYVGFDTTEAPTDNVHLRRALSLAIDREDLIANVTRGGQTAAQWFSYPGLTAAPTLETHPDLGITFDPEQAQAELEAAMADLGAASVEELPTIVLVVNDSAGHTAIMEAIQQMWTENLGINAEISLRETTGYFSGLREDAPMAYRAGWCQDYSDANNFMYEVFGSWSEFNYAGFADETYDELVTQARTLTDENERRELYAQAEEILVDEVAAIAPIYWYVTNELSRPEVERTYSITGNQYYYKWDLAG